MSSSGGTSVRGAPAEGHLIRWASEEVKYLVSSVSSNGGTGVRGAALEGQVAGELLYKFSARRAPVEG